MIEEKCVICQADFRNSALKDGKCPICTTMFPGVNSREELKLKNSPNKAVTLTDTVVQKMIYDTLEEAGLKRHTCEKCLKLYYRTSPNQKQCPACKDAK